MVHIETNNKKSLITYPPLSKEEMKIRIHGQFRSTPMPLHRYIVFLKEGLAISLPITFRTDLQRRYTFNAVTPDTVLVPHKSTRDSIILNNCSLNINE